MVAQKSSLISAWIWTNANVSSIPLGQTEWTTASVSRLVVEKHRKHGSNEAVSEYDSVSFLQTADSNINSAFGIECFSSYSLDLNELLNEWCFQSSSS